MGSSGATSAPPHLTEDFDALRVETKELLGGFVILEAADLDEAVAIASEWPSLSTQKNATVQIEPVYVRPEGGTAPA